MNYLMVILQSLILISLVEIGNHLKSSKANHFRRVELLKDIHRGIEKVECFRDIDIRKLEKILKFKLEKEKVFWQ